MRVWQVALALAIALGLVLGVVLPGFAAPDKPGTPENRPPLRMLKGSVVSLDEGQEFFVIETGDGETTILVNDDTRYFKVPFPQRLAATVQNRVRQAAPRLKGAEFPNPPPFTTQKAHSLQAGVLNRACPFGQEASFEDLSVGAKVMVRAVPEEGELLAKVVLIIKLKVPSRVKGVVSAVSPGDETLTITPEDGDAITLTFDDKTHFHLIGVTGVEVGQLANVVYSKDLVARLVFINPGIGG